DALSAGRSAIRAISAFDASPYPSRVAGEVLDYEPHPAIDPDRAAGLDRGALFAVDAALQALEDSALPITPENAVQAGLVLGSARPGEGASWAGHDAFHKGGPQDISAGYIGRTLANAPAAQAAAALGIRGPAVAIAAGGASGHAAIATAAEMVRRGDVQVAFAGGADAAITPLTLAAFCALDVLTKRNDEPSRACRPFDADADGFALAEGAAMLVLEDEELARQRGARIYARLAGRGFVTEPGAATPMAQEAGRAIQAALRQPALLQSEIDYFCAYGCGVQELDRMETEAIKRIFGELTASKLTLSAPKSMLGHMLGASGAVDAIICVKAIETGVVPPTINLDQPAEGCDLDYTPNEARTMNVRHAMSYAYGFGGHHLALCFSAP
ncbi:MAG: beta-ketoacyl-[acyl-carrier-protein] synthase II, partial [Chloroflexi bacterium]|nr:beta-ketoacyl-[acyl-carrier-protein] synthase II [Chloroflexota bacterium]